MTRRRSAGDRDARDRATDRRRRTERSGHPHRDRRRADLRGRGAPETPIVVELQDVSCYYGSFRAVRNVDLTVAQAADHRADRSVRLRQVDAPADDQPDERPGPVVPHRRADPARRAGPVRQGRRSGRRPTARRDGLPEAEPVPEVDLGERRLRRQDQRLQGQPRRARRAQPAPRRAVGRRQGQAQAVRHGAVGRPAAAAVHRPDDRHRARGHPDGRAVLGARPARARSRSRS